MINSLFISMYLIHQKYVSVKSSWNPILFSSVIELIWFQLLPIGTEVQNNKKINISFEIHVVIWEGRNCFERSFKVFAPQTAVPCVRTTCVVPFFPSHRPNAVKTGVFVSHAFCQFINLFDIVVFDIDPAVNSIKLLLWCCLCISSVMHVNLMMSWWFTITKLPVCVPSCLVLLV